jgi:hypothetical protein
VKKAYFVPMEKKHEAQVLQDISLSPSERVLRMFELMEALSFLRKYEPIQVSEGGVVVTLKRRKDGKGTGGTLGTSGTCYDS